MKRVVSEQWSVAVVGFVAAVWIGFGPTCKALEFPGPTPGRAAARLEGERLILQNAVIGATWNLAANRFELAEVVDRVSGDTVRARAAEAFVVTLGGGRSLKASELRPDGKPSLEKLQPRGESVGRSHRFAGWKATVPLVSSDGKIRVQWQAVLRDESNYVQQQVTLRTEENAVPAKEVAIIYVDAPKAKVAGIVDGSPVVAGNLFFACENPMAKNRVEDGRVVCSVRQYGPPKPDRPWTAKFVIGVVPAGQLRRAFLYYVDRERPRPYRPFLHYVSWYDIAWVDRKMNEQQCLGVIDIFGRELFEKRGVRLDSFVFDDGWDDNKTLWKFHEGFPRGFTPLQSAAAKYDSGVGVWVSPWGGYSHAKKERLKYGRTQGFETNRHGFTLAGPKYYARFRDVCVEMIQKYNVNYFKFDGIGSDSYVSPSAGGEFAADIEGLLRLIADLRQVRPDLYVSTTAGTWPSPYWLWYGDSIWRGGSDTGHHGEGSSRQQWLTYRDMIVHKLIVCRAPLFPLNSLKSQKIVYAQLGDATKMSGDLKDIVDEIHMLFASGTQIQDLLITPRMMTPKMWDALAEGATWSRQNADVLIDTHWIGGDPGKGEVYGYASWSPRKAIFVLRNPSDAPATFNLDVQTAFELPPDAPRRYLTQSPWKQNEGHTKITLQAGQPHRFDLAPFEALVLEALPVK